MAWLGANSISATEVRHRGVTGSSTQSPILIQIDIFLPQIERCLLGSTASPGYVTTLKERHWYLQRFVLFNYNQNIPDKLPEEARSSSLYFMIVLLSFASPGTQFYDFKSQKATLSASTYTFSSYKHMLFFPYITVAAYLKMPAEAFKTTLL